MSLPEKWEHVPSGIFDREGDEIYYYHVPCAKCGLSMKLRLRPQRQPTCSVCNQREAARRSEEERLVKQERQQQRDRDRALLPWALAALVLAFALLYLVVVVFGHQRVI